MAEERRERPCCILIKRCFKTPFRYNSLISLRKSLAFLGLSWGVSVAISLPALLSVPPLQYRPEFGACLPNFAHNPVFPTVYCALGIVAPIGIIIGFNLKIVSIAKYHQYRIGNALLGMALESTASATEVNRVVREKAKVREEQKAQLRNFQGMNAVATLSQLVGTLILFYYSFVAVGLYEAYSAKTVHPLVMETCVLLLFVSPVVNGFIFGLKNKVGRPAGRYFAWAKSASAHFCADRPAPAA